MVQFISLWAKGTQRLPAPALRRSASCGNTQRPMPVLIMEYTNLTGGGWNELKWTSKTPLDLVIFVLCFEKRYQNWGNITDWLWMLNTLKQNKTNYSSYAIFLNHFERSCLNIFTAFGLSTTFTNPRFPVMEHWYLCQACESLTETWNDITMVQWLVSLFWKNQGCIVRKIITSPLLSPWKIQKGWDLEIVDTKISAAFMQLLTKQLKKGHFRPTVLYHFLWGWQSSALLTGMICLLFRCHQNLDPKIS